MLQNANAKSTRRNFKTAYYMQSEFDNISKNKSFLSKSEIITWSYQYVNAAKGVERCVYN